MKLSKTIDLLLAILWLTIFFLLLTGGIYGKFEFSQIDTFGSIALSLSAIRWYLHKDFLPPRIKQLLFYIKDHFKKLNPTSFVFILTGIHVFLYTWILKWKFNSFDLNAYDLGYIDQSVWSTAHLNGPHTFLHSSLSKGSNYLGEHFSPLLGIFAPFYSIWDNVLWLFFFHSLLLASGAILIFFLVQHHQRTPANWFTCVPSIFFLLYQPLRSANLFGPREDMFYIPILLGIILSLEKKKWVWFWILCFATLGIKENAPLVTLLISFWLFFRKNTVQAILLCMVSVFSFILINSYIMPVYSGNNAPVLMSRLGFLGHNTQDVFRNIFFHPLDSVYKTFIYKINLGSGSYLLKTYLPFLPFLFIRPLSNGFVWIVALALSVMNLLIAPQTIGFHYELIFIPFLFVGLSYAFSKNISLNKAILLFLLGFCVFGRSPILSLRLHYPNQEHRCLKKLLAGVHPQVSIQTTSSLFPHLDHRKDVTIFGSADQANEDLLIFSFLKNLSLYSSENIFNEIPKLNSKKYTLLVKNHLIEVWCKKDFCIKALDFKKQIESEVCASMYQ